MQFTTVLASLASMVAMTSAVSVSYDTGYDDAGRSLAVVSCSDGSNGLLDRFPTQGNLPRFPYIGGFDDIAGWNSANCGKCHSVTYNGKTIFILAIDHSASGFNIAQAAMNDLTNGKAAELGRIDAQTAVVALSNCGL